MIAAAEEPTDLTSNVEIVRICGQRDAAIRKMREATECFARAAALAVEAEGHLKTASRGEVFTIVDRRDSEAFRSLFHSVDTEAALRAYRHHVDASIWKYVLAATGVEMLMDAEAREDFLRQLASDNVPEVNEGNIAATAERFRDEAGLIFQRGLANSFTALDRRFKSHDAFRFEDRIIFANVFDQWGYLSWSCKGFDHIADVERVMAVLDGQPPAPGALRREIEASRGRGMAPRQGLCESTYFRIRTFKNGNAHVWFTRKDLVAKANKVLADYYGAVLPDAAPADVEKPLRGELAKSLQFYPTPLDAARRLVDTYISPGARVLEPSAGAGHLILALVEKQPDVAVTAIEVDAARCAAIPSLSGRVNAVAANFLRVPPDPSYDLVLMNPPFYGTHWMEHVRHAYEFLAPGGILRTILPATAEVGTSQAHEDFRAWAKVRSKYEQLRFTDLPPESFAASGTRVQTVILQIQRGAS